MCIRDRLYICNCCSLWTIYECYNGHSGQTWGLPSDMFFIQLLKLRDNFCQVYRPNIMNCSEFIEWCCLFMEGITNIHDEEHSNYPTVMTETIQQWWQTVQWKRHRTKIMIYILEFLTQFHNILFSIMCDMVKVNMITTNCIWYR